MKKNGFVFVETIIAIIVLSSSLLLLYTSFSKLLQIAKTRLNYDDLNYIYRSWYLKKELQNLNVSSVLRYLSDNDNKYFLTVGLEYDSLFSGYEDKKDYFSNFLSDFEVSQILIIKENKLSTLKRFDENCNYQGLKKTVCNDLYGGVSPNMISYLKTIDVDFPCIYILAVEYTLCSDDNTDCKNYYSWVSM